MEKIFNNKKKILIGMISIISIFLIYILFLSGTYSIVISSDSEKISKEFEKLNGVSVEDEKEYPEVKISDNKFVYTNIDEIINIFNNKGDAVIFFGYSTCLYCRTAIQVLHDTSVDTEIDKILYLDVEEKKSGYDLLLNFLNEDMKIVENDEEVIYSPLVLFVADGKIVSYHKGTLFSQYSPYSKLDRSQVDGLSEIFKYGIRDVIDGMKNNK